MNLIRTLNLGLAFVLELAMLAAFVFWGFHLNLPFYGRILLGIGVPVGVAVFWGFFLAPQANYSIGLVPSVVIKFVLFGLAGLALYLSDKKSWGVGLFVIFTISEVLALVWHQEQ